MKAIEALGEVRKRINAGTTPLEALGEVEGMLTPTGKSKPAGYGGTKGTAILRALVKYGDDPHKLSEVAEEVGCSIGRVGEVKRQLALEDITAEQAIATLDSKGQPTKAQTAAKARQETATKAAQAPEPARLRATKLTATAAERRRGPREAPATKA